MVICEKDRCTGCTACLNVCPKDAISMERNEKGFLYPVIDTNKCVECGRCQKTCHINKDINYNDVKAKFLFKNKDFEVRRASSSGGSFAPMADRIIKQGGAVIGAEFSDEVRVQHNCYEDMEHARKFSTSKYVQSDLRDSYKTVSNLLSENRKVIFSGTPCQVSGLNSYLETIKCPTDNLITVDFICHGVGSPKFWDDCLEYYSKKRGSKVVAANFRGKPRPGKLQNLALTYANGKKTVAPSANMEVYFFHFLKNYILRDSCFSCKYSKTERVSDITMGDCFRAQSEVEYLHDGFGLSQVMANTDKGLEFLNTIGEYGDLVMVDTKDYIQPNQRAATPKPGSYDSFWKAYTNGGFSGALKATGYTNAKNRIKHAILTVTYVLNIDPKKVLGVFKK